MDQSKVNITKMEAFLRTETNKKFTKYFLQTGSPRYLEEKILSVFHKIDQILEGKVAQF